jgi:ABC-type transport system involved in multi-copper enzyme maturation permease subunit
VYLPFTILFFTEILPALAAGGTGATENPPAGFAVALLRVTYFYGYGFPAIAIAGFLLARREKEKWAVRILTAYGLSFLGLLALRAVSGMFKDLKEFVYVGPLVAVSAGLALHSLWRHGRWGRIAAVMVAAGLIGFGLSKYGEYFRMHTVLAGLPID